MPTEGGPGRDGENNDAGNTAPTVDAPGRIDSRSQPGELVVGGTGGLVRLVERAVLSAGVSSRSHGKPDDLRPRPARLALRNPQGMLGRSVLDPILDDRDGDPDDDTITPVVPRTPLAEAIKRGRITATFSAAAPTGCDEFDDLPLPGIGAGEER